MDNLLVRLYVTCIAKMLLIIGCKGSDFPIFFRNFTPRFNMFFYEELSVNTSSTKIGSTSYDTTGTEK
jgi:hypothetical protein